MFDLRNEAMIYNLIKSIPGIPKMLVSEYMGTNLKKLQQYVGNRFSLDTVYKIGH
jgi:hypothetical protein